MKPIQHGTNAGYTAHVRRNEAACEPCAEARRVYSRNQKRAKRAGIPPRLPVGCAAVPLAVLGALYTEAAIPGQKAAESALGGAVIDLAVAALDEVEAAYNEELA